MPSTVIDSTDFLITSARDETVEGFDTSRNKNVEFLPINLGEKFPKLIILSASGCSIKGIAKENFKGLNMLRHLLLIRNQIERVDDDTFEFIPAVERISLGEQLSVLLIEFIIIIDFTSF